jgi:hypothetical protein
VSPEKAGPDGTTSKKLRLTVPPGILLDLEVTLDEIPIVVTRVTQEFIKAGIIIPGGAGIEVSTTKAP